MTINLPFVLTTDTLPFVVTFVLSAVAAGVAVVAGATVDDAVVGVAFTLVVPVTVAAAPAANVPGVTASAAFVGVAVARFAVTVGAADTPPLTSAPLVMLGVAAEFNVVLAVTGVRPPMLT